MHTSLAARREAFRQLHERGCFVLPNPWDIGGAKRLEALGFSAIASTSAGYAWSIGRQDGGVSRDQVLHHLKELCEATGLPVNADFEAGFADTPDGVGASVALAIETGVAGLSIEDQKGTDLYSMPQAVERIAAARKAIDASGQNVLLVCRTEGLLIGKSDVNESIRRLAAYSAAGADCLYAPGLQDLSDVRNVVTAVAPKPVNVLLMGALTVPDLAAAGVRRVSTGSGLARASWNAFEAAAISLRDHGTYPASRTY